MMCSIAKYGHFWAIFPNVLPGMYKVRNGPLWKCDSEAENVWSMLCSSMDVLFYSTVPVPWAERCPLAGQGPASGHGSSGTPSSSRGSRAGWVSQAVPETQPNTEKRSQHLCALGRGWKTGFCLLQCGRAPGFVSGTAGPEPPFPPSYTRPPRFSFLSPPFFFLNFGTTAATIMMINSLISSPFLKKAQ